jgi:hypothetical protein
MAAVGRAKVLFLAADPFKQNALALGEEVKAITKWLWSADVRQIELVSAWAVTQDDLRHQLLLNKPDVVHFSGHGMGKAGLILHGDDGRRRAMGTEALVSMFEAIKDNLQVVVFNACFASEQARAVADVVGCSIGMNDQISDKGAMKFAEAFYHGLGFGRTVRTAFDLGRQALIDAEPREDHIPELFRGRNAVPPEQLCIPPKALGDPPERHSVRQEQPAPPAKTTPGKTTAISGTLVIALLFLCLGTWVAAKPQLLDRDLGMLAGCVAGVAALGGLLTKERIVAGLGIGRLPLVFRIAVAAIAAVMIALWTLGIGIVHIPHDDASLGAGGLGFVPTLHAQEVKTIEFDMYSNSTVTPENQNFAVCIGRLSRRQDVELVVVDTSRMTEPEKALVLECQSVPKVAGGVRSFQVLLRDTVPWQGGRRRFNYMGRSYEMVITPKPYVLSNVAHVSLQALPGSVRLPQVRIFTKISEPSSHPTEKLEVSDGMTLVGGGCESSFADNNPVHLLTASYPAKSARNRDEWRCAGRQHDSGGLGTVTVYVLAVPSDSLAGGDIRIVTTPGGRSIRPRAIAEIESPYVLVGGGCMSNTDGRLRDLGPLITASYPSDERSWTCLGKTARRDGANQEVDGPITAFAIGIRSSALTRVSLNFVAQSEAASMHPAVTSALTPGGNSGGDLPGELQMLGGGCSTTEEEGVGVYLVKSYPMQSKSLTGWRCVFGRQGLDGKAKAKAVTLAITGGNAR